MAGRQHDRIPWWIHALSLAWPFIWPVFAFAVGYGVLTGRLLKFTGKIGRLVHSRRSLAISSLLPVVILALIDARAMWQYYTHFSTQRLSNEMTLFVRWMPGVIANFVWFTVLGLTVYLLAPGRRAKVAE